MGTKSLTRKGENDIVLSQNYGSVCFLRPKNVFHQVIMSYSLRKFLKKSTIVTILAVGYSIWLWWGKNLGLLRLAANTLSVVGMVFFVWGLLGLVHNTHAMAAFSYSFRYVVNMVRNLKNRDDATDEEIIEYHEYVASYEKRDNILWCFIAAAGFTVLSLALWFLS